MTDERKPVRVIVEDWAGKDERRNRPMRVGVERWSVVLRIAGHKFHRTIEATGPKFLLNQAEAKILAKSLAKALGVKPEYPTKKN